VTGIISGVDCIQMATSTSHRHPWIPQTHPWNFILGCSIYPWLQSNIAEGWTHAINL